MPDLFDFENRVREQVAASIAKSSEIAVYGEPSYDEVTEAINALSQAEFLERLSWALAGYQLENTPTH